MVSAVYARRISESDATDNNTCRFGLVFFFGCYDWKLLYDRGFDMWKDLALKNDSFFFLFAVVIFLSNSSVE